MEEVRLFRVPAAYQVTIRLEPDGAWTLTFHRFFEGERWTLDDSTVYAELSLMECADVVLNELFTVRP